MLEMGERSLVVGFRPVADATELLLSSISDVATAVGFGDDDALMAVLESASPAIQELIYAGLLERVEIVADDVQVAIGMRYYPDATEEDELGFANLDLLQIGASQLDLCFVVTSGSHAQTLTANALAALSTATIEVALSEPAEVADEKPEPVDENDTDVADSQSDNQQEGDLCGDQG